MDEHFEVESAPGPASAPNKPRAAKKSAPAKPKRERGRKVGPVEPREMTKVRDEIGAIRDLAAAYDTGTQKEVYERLNALFSTVDAMDLRFLVHWDKSAKKQK